MGSSPAFLSNGLFLQNLLISRFLKAKMISKNLSFLRFTSSFLSGLKVFNDFFAALPVIIIQQNSVKCSLSFKGQLLLGTFEKFFSPSFLKKNKIIYEKSVYVDSFVLYSFSSKCK